MKSSWYPTHDNTKLTLVLSKKKKSHRMMEMHGNALLLEK